MFQYLKTILVILMNFNFYWCSDIFHVNSKITFVPDKVANYFGYSISLSDQGLHVGAPKAENRTVKGIFPGLVFSCPLAELNKKTVVCEPFMNKDRNRISRYIPSDFYKDDMWFGAVVTAVSKDKLFVCAPRYTVKFNETESIQGVCYMHSKNRERAIYPLINTSRQFTRLNGSREEYRDYFQLNNYNPRTSYRYFLFGQVGMSATVTSNNSILLGAPGVLLWSGTTVEIKIRKGDLAPIQMPVSNPYNTLEFGADDLFGYSVGSGVFDKTGTVLFVSGAPRSSNGYGKVLIYEPPTNEKDSLRIKAKLVGPELGSYFGSSLCTVDIDGDGLSDILVGAPNFIERDGLVRYDQGAVFVYMSRAEYSTFVLKASGYVRGSGEDGARFGTAIANLGDIDGDGFRDVAVGAPYENNGAGAVYIYKGNKDGLNKQPIQKIQAERSRGFGFAISQGYDVDNNKYNDIAIGAFDSGTAYIYRSIPMLQVLTSIKLSHDKKNATHFKVQFCIKVPTRSFTNAETDMKAVISVDPKLNRAKSLGAPEFIVKVKSNLDTCEEHIIEVKNQSDFSMPLVLEFNLQPVENIDSLEEFPTNIARISEDSNLQSSFAMQVLPECGDARICMPWLEMSMEPFTSPYVPGLDRRLGLTITVVNKNEPAFSVKLVVQVPSGLRRLPHSCLLQEGQVVCNLPAPLRRGELATWDLELQYTWIGIDRQLNVTAGLNDPLYQRNISDGVKELIIPITPKTDFDFSAKVEPNDTITVSRETFDNHGDVLFTHYYKLVNRGPSDLYDVNIVVFLPEEVNIIKTNEDNMTYNQTIWFNETIIKAGAAVTYDIPLRFNLSDFGDKLESSLTLNLTSVAHLNASHFGILRLQTATTILILEPKIPLWPIIVAIVVGLLLLALSILGLYKLGFFSRRTKEDMEELLDNDTAPSNGKSSSPASDGDEEIKDQEKSETDDS